MSRRTDRLADMHSLLLGTVRCNLGTRFEVMLGAAPQPWMQVATLVSLVVRSRSQINGHFLSLLCSSIPLASLRELP